MPAKCKNPDCTTSRDTIECSGLEASGYCFACAEEMACLLAEVGADPSSAWNATKGEETDA